LVVWCGRHGVAKDSIGEAGMPVPDLRGARKLEDWRRLLAEERGGFYRALVKLYGDEPEVVEEKRALFLRAVDAFAEEFGEQAQVLIVRAPGRINLMGMHVDHRGGYVNPIAFGELILVVQPRDDDRVVLKNVDRDRFPERSFAISEQLPQRKIEDWDEWTQRRVAERKSAGMAGDWSDYVKSAVLYLQHIHTREDGSFSPPLRGMNAMLYGTIPAAAGLSSSSSIVVATAEACRRINGLDLSDMQMVDACAEAEWYVGTRGGGGDHAAIKFARLDHVTHIGSFPLSAEWIPFPPDYRVVVADSLKKAEKSAGARDIFNQRVASYVFGLMLVRKNFPHLAPRLKHLRDLNPRTLGTDEAEIYRIIRSLPEVAGRPEIRKMLSDRKEEVERVFASHREPADGYKVRQVCLYGVSECLRSEMAADMLKKGDIQGFGELINISHDGDRVTRLENGRRVPNDNRYPDWRIDALIADLECGDAQRRERARLWRQPGGYDVSAEELDVLVDVARASPGVVGAGLVGAGLGGSIVAVVRDRDARRLIENIVRYYYRPRNLSPAASIVRPVGGAGVIEIE